MALFFRTILSRFNAAVFCSLESMSTVLKTASQHAVREAHAILGTKSFEEISQCIRNNDTDALTRLFQQLIEKAIHGDTGDLKQLIRARICFEQSACLLISDMPELSDALINDKGAELLAEMESVAAAATKSNAKYKRFHQMDCEFHCLLAELGSIASVATIVRALESLEVAYGQPTNAVEMRNLHLEHKRIIGAIESQDRDEIRVAVKEHIEVAFSRWLHNHCMEAKMSLLNGPSQYQSEIDSMVNAFQAGSQVELTPIQKDRMRWEVEFQKTFPNEYVVYKIIVIERQEHSRQVREVLMHSKDWDEIVAYTENLDESERASIRVDHYAA